MAGLTKLEKAGKDLYLASSDPPPEVEWKDLPDKDREKWIAQVDAQSDAPEPKVSKEKPEPPGTDPEHGDLTPDFVDWYKAHHTAEEYAAKYNGREHIIDIVRNGGAA